MTKLIFAITLTLIVTIASAQLKGSGKTITRTYDFQNFDKVHFEDLDGKLEIEIGQSFSINVTIDVNLQKLLSITESPTEHLLIIRFDNNKNNRQYIENSGLKIKITMPEASVIRNNGNSNLQIRNVIGRYFRIENAGNGDTRISGTTDSLEIEKLGNGGILAEKLIAKKATVSSVGNGNVYVNVSLQLTATLRGNGDIKNIGVAPFNSKSTKTGNGDFIKTQLF